jgi:hypothetical protein
VRILTIDDGGLELRVDGLFVIVDHEPLALCTLNCSPELLNFPFHFRMLGALANTLEIGFDLALELQTIAAGAALKRFLHHIAT